MFAVVGAHEPNLNDFVEEFLELNLIVGSRHVRAFGLKAERKKRENLFNSTQTLSHTFSVSKCLNVSNERA